MRNRFYILVALLACYTLSMAQPDSKGQNNLRQKIEAERIQYINEKVGFTNDEAALFWSLEGEFKNEMRKLHEDSKQIKTNLGENASEKEYQNALSALIKNEEKIFELKEKYNTKYLQVIPASKLFKYYEAEFSYKHQLMRRLEKSPLSCGKK